MNALKGDEHKKQNYEVTGSTLGSQQKEVHFPEISLEDGTRICDSEFRMKQMFKLMLMEYGRRIVVKCRINFLIYTGQFFSCYAWSIGRHKIFWWRYRRRLPGIRIIETYAKLNRWATYNLETAQVHPKGTTRYWYITKQLQINAENAKMEGLALSLK